MKLVSDVMRHKQTDEIYHVSPIETVFEAIKMMSTQHVGALPVLQEDRLVGIVSERDYARKVILKDRASKSTRVSEIMTQKVITVSRDDSVDDCVALMQEHHIRHLVVIDEGAVIGMLSLRDLFTEIMGEQRETIAKLEHYIRGEA